MKDLKGDIIRVGDQVHIFDGDSLDIIVTAVGTRGRGIKFVDEDGKSYEANAFQGREIPVTYNILKTKSEFKPKPSKENTEVTQEELHLISQLIAKGWTGKLYKNIGTNIQYSVNIG